MSERHEYCCIALRREVFEVDLVLDVLPYFFHGRSVGRCIGPACVDDVPKCIRYEAIGGAIGFIAIMEFHHNLDFTRQIMVWDLTGKNLDDRLSALEDNCSTQGYLQQYATE